MSGDEVFRILWVVVAYGVGAWLILTAPRRTEAMIARRDQAREEHADRPVLLRPAIANQPRPSVFRTRATGVGFCLLGTIGLVTLL